MTYTVGDFYDVIDSFAAFSTADGSDNVGLLVGSRRLKVRAALVSLDATGSAIEEAQNLGANLMITHHPVRFSGIKSVSTDDILYRLIAAGISVISAHTNLDAAEGGVNDTLCGMLGLKNIRPMESALYPGLARVGELPGPMSSRELAKLVRNTVGIPALKFTECDTIIKTVAICGGSGGDLMDDAIKAGAQAFITADVKHHLLIAARDAGFTIMDAGHYATEATVVKPLAERLAAMLPNVGVVASQTQRDPAEYVIDN